MTAYSILAALALAANPDPTASTVGGADLILNNARVWNGDGGFEPKALYVADGLFVDTPPEGATEVDLGGGWVIPPLADAHTHRFSGERDAPQAREMYLASGVLYVANLCSPKDARAQSAEHAGGATGIDVLFSNGGLTATDGHPVKLYEGLHTGVYRQPADTFWETNNDSSFYIVDDEDDLDEKWALLLATKPDLVKTLLSFSEEFDKRRDDERFYGAKGLDPKLLPAVVARAREAGLRVATHVDTAGDFRAAVRAGVDFIAHTPGYGARADDRDELFALTPADARAAREAGVVHITTTCVARREAGREMMRRNIGVLKEAGVPIAIGSDHWMGGIDPERETLLDLELFEPDELLRAWCVDTVRALYPDRRLGSLAPGFEGSLVVLGGDPLVNPGKLDDVRLVVKRGRVLWEAE
ncbi:MAG: amidohydrolase family protein [Planctomycetota bacterium]